jgi:hypothetical protein
MPMWMYGYSWPAVFWMVGGALFWVILLSAATWLFARWAGHILARLDSATRRLDHARDDLLRARDANIEEKRAMFSAPDASVAHEAAKRL